MPSRVDEFLAASVRRQRLLRISSGVAVTAAIVATAWITSSEAIVATVQLARVQWHGVRVHPKHNLPYVYIPSGSFSIGCSEHPGRCAAGEVTHRVWISQSFWIGQTEVTQKAFRDVMKRPAPQEYQADDKPVHTVDWFESESFCESAGLRLPTEDEWEYAARAGTLGEHYGDLNQIAVIAAVNGPSAVMTKLPNRWGLYDMLGNVWEWAGSAYDNESKVLRGGSWNYNPVFVRVSNRDGLEPSFRGNNVGFRCAGELR